MKRFVWILVLLMAASPAWSANRKTTVQQLKDLLVSLQQAKKSDADVATELSQIELTEELTHDVMESLASYLPGPLATEQIYVLEARSAVLAPPASDLPSTPAPDAAAQKAILEKAIGYATKTYAQLPYLTATKTTLRFQNIVRPAVAATGTHTDKPPTDPNLASGGQLIRYIGPAETHVEIQGGVEILPKVTDQTRWGANGQIALLGQGPVLGVIVQEAQAAGKLNWLRWETVNGIQTAVFSFAVDKKKSHYAVNYCCFPSTAQVGPRALQTDVTWENYKATVPYHGEIFVDPAAGIVVRLVTVAEFKAADVVHQEDTRIDYGPATVGGKPLVLPVRTIIDTEVVTGGQDFAGKYSTCRTLFTVDYKDYQPAGAAH